MSVGCSANMACALAGFSAISYKPGIVQIHTNLTSFTPPDCETASQGKQWVGWPTASLHLFNKYISNQSIYIFLYLSIALENFTQGNLFPPTVWCETNLNLNLMVQHTQSTLDHRGSNNVWIPFLSCKYATLLLLHPLHIALIGEELTVAHSGGERTKVSAWPKSPNGDLSKKVVVEGEEEWYLTKGGSNKTFSVFWVFSVNLSDYKLRVGLGEQNKQNCQNSSSLNPHTHTLHSTTPRLSTSRQTMCLGMWARLHLFHVSCEGVIIAEAVTFSDIQTRTRALLWAFSVAVSLNQRGTLIGWPGINGTHHMWDISLRIKKKYFKIEKKKTEKSSKPLRAVKQASAVKSPAQARGPLPVAQCV